MGFGLPSAVGAKVAAPNKIVVDIDGDASFSMTAMELATASQYNIGVKVMVLNNEFQGMVLQWQGSSLLTRLFFSPWSSCLRVDVPQTCSTKSATRIRA